MESADDIYQIACAGSGGGPPLRLLGLGVSGFMPPSLQISLPL